MKKSKLASGITAVAKFIGIEAVCATHTDYQTVLLARAVELRNQPKAQYMLDFYISGKGKTHDVLVDTQTLFKEDQGVREKFWKDFGASYSKGSKSGIVPIPQPVYKNDEWRNSLGSINLQWKIVDNGKNVEIWFTNRYRWHPNAKRISQCVHQAADNLKDSMGAAEFQMNGKHIKFTIPTNEKKHILG
jgi:hypothetical protein